VRVWDPEAGPRASFESRTLVNCTAVTPDGRTAVSAGQDSTVGVWDLEAGRCRASLEGHAGAVMGVAVTPDGRTAVSGSMDETVRVWDLEAGRCRASLEGHTGAVYGVAVTPDGRTAVSGTHDGTVRVWDLTELDRLPRKPAREPKYTNAKVLFVGETGVGKSGLAYRLTTDEFHETISTDAAWATKLHLPHKPRSKATEREIWLWDFAGQIDYRLIHRLYMDETALCVFVFNPQSRNPFDGLAEWDRDICRAAKRPFAKLLVAGRCDVGRLMVSRKQIDDFCQQHNFIDYIETSAQTGEGCKKLHDAIVQHIPWDDIPWTASPRLFKLLKDTVINIKDRTYAAKLRKGEERTPVLLPMDALRQRIHLVLPGESFTEAELRAVVGLLHGPGVVWKLEFGDLVLLQPERINAYAAAVIRTVRSRTDDIGVIAEARVLDGNDLDFGAVVRLPAPEEATVRRAMHQLLVDRGLCIREKGQLVFPSLFTRARPEKIDFPNILMTYRFAGHLDEIYATLVVHLDSTRAFERDQLWLDAADFKTQEDKPIGLRMTRLGEGRAEITVYAALDVSNDSKVMFNRYVYEHLRTKDAAVARLRHYYCPTCGKPVRDEKTVEEARAEGGDLFCARCGKPIPLLDLIEQKFGSAKAAAEVRKMGEESQEKLETESTELILIAHAIEIADRAGHTCWVHPNSARGIDGEIEFKDHNGTLTGKRLYLQLRSRDSYLRKRQRDEAEVLTIKDPLHAGHWQQQKYPVMLVVRTSDDVIRWMDVRKYLKEQSAGGKTAKQVIFNGEPFTPESVRRLCDHHFPRPR
jgi:small GTP-binding protein